MGLPIKTKSKPIRKNASICRTSTDTSLALSIAEKVSVLSSEMLLLLCMSARM